MSAQQLAPEMLSEVAPGMWSELSVGLPVGLSPVLERRKGARPFDTMNM